jgi:hypothetical protein
MHPQMSASPPPVDDGFDRRQIEVVIGLRQGAAELGLELDQLVRRYGG